ncbi:MAG: hypothetical protein NZ807_04855 [Dehalococcoidia bacterium]|nr:hypothetical protein [Dehalococcoidia bacterium]
MTFDNQTQKSKYIAGIRDLLRLFYGTKDLNSAYRKKLEAKLDGFIAAGLLINLISEKELQNIIDEEYMTVFGMTRNERREKLKLESNETEIDWKIYDIPTIHRQ